MAWYTDYRPLGVGVPVMFLKVTAVADAVGVDERMVLDWIRYKGLPAHKQDDRYRINRIDLLEWATANGVVIPPRLFEAAEDEISLPTVFSALKRGGIHFGLPGDTAEEALREVVNRLKLSHGLDPEFLLQTLLAREALGSTAFGNGIAIPHVRNPIVGQTDDSAISLCFLKKPIDFAAIDGKPVNILFTFITVNVKEHLHLLAKLAFLLHDQYFQNLLHVPGSEAEIMSAVSSLEETTIRR